MTNTTPIHPGQILWQDFLMPMNITCYRLAKGIGVPVNRIVAIIHEERRITPETGLLLSRYFELPDSFWLGLQVNYDTECAKEALKERLDRIVAVAYEQRT